MFPFTLRSSCMEAACANRDAVRHLIRDSSPWAAGSPAARHFTQLGCLKFQGKAAADAQAARPPNATGVSGIIRYPSRRIGTDAC